MDDKSFAEIIDDIETAMANLRSVPRRMTQYDEETILTLEEEKRDSILKNLRRLEREYYKSK